MATSLTSTGITFPDSTTQTTAAIARSGSTATTSATDITLTASSTQVQNVTMTASGKAVILPNATTLTAGVAVFQICNSGAYYFSVKNASGEILGTVASNQAAFFTLVENSTTVGNWASASMQYALVGTVDSLSTATASTASYVMAEMLSSTLLVVGYYDGTNLKLMAGSISGTSISWGTPVIVKTTTGAYFTIIRAMSSTQAFLAYSYVSGNNRANYVRGVSISGTTITLGTETTLSSNNLNVAVETQGADMFGSTLIFCYNVYSYNGYLRAATISGSTLTLGTGIASGNASSGITKYDDSTVLWGYYDGTNFKARFFTVSGTTLTGQGTAYTAPGEAGNGITASSTQILVGATNSSFGSSGTQYLVTFSGYTISSIVATGGTEFSPGIRPTTSGTYAATYNSAKLLTYDVAGTTVSSTQNALMPSSYSTSILQNVGTSGNYIAQPYLYNSYVGVYVYRVA